MRTELKISDIKTVYEGSMAEGEIDNTNKKRYSDALVYFYRGKVEYIFGDKRLIAEGGTVIYLPKGSSYYMIITEHSDYIVADFDFEDTADDCGILFTSLSPKVKGDFEKLFRTGHSREAWS